MYVQQVEIVQLRDLGHARGQRQIVRRIVEQRVPRHFDFVIMNIGFGSPEPDGLGVGNEMDLVAALGQFETKFGGHDAAAAVCGVTSDPNLHSATVRPFSVVLYSMAGNNRGCRLYRRRGLDAREGRFKGEELLFGLWPWHGNAGIQLVQVGLEAFLGVVW